MIGDHDSYFLPESRPKPQPKSSHNQDENTKQATDNTSLTIKLHTSDPDSFILSIRHYQMSLGISVET